MFHDFFNAEVTIGLVGIAATAGIGFLIYGLQRRADNDINKIIREQAKITVEQAKITEAIRSQRVGWMAYHLVTLLNSLRNNYTDIIALVDKYQEEKSDRDKTEVNERKLASLSKIAVSSTLAHLRDIAERDIDAAKDFIKNSWLAVKFQDSLSVLGMGVPLDEIKISVMDSRGFYEYKENIQRYIDNIDNYIKTIKEEIGDEAV